MTPPLHSPDARYGITARPLGTRYSRSSCTTSARRDVVTHHVTAMVVQADAAQLLPHGDQARVGIGLAAISDTGRRALAELRHTSRNGHAPPTSRAGPSKR